MKRLFIMGTLAFLVASCSSEQKTEKKQKGLEIPVAVLDAFKQNYPIISDVDWQKEGVNYEATFETIETETSVVLDVSGKILETETEMESTFLPKAALHYIETHYIGQKVKEAAKIVLNDGTINYEAEVNNKDLIFDSNGSFIKMATEQSENQ